MTIENKVNMITNKINRYCYENNISLNEFALRCGFTYSTLHHISNGETKDIKFSTICSISKGMNLKLCDFFQDKEFEKIDNSYL